MPANPTDGAALLAGATAESLDALSAWAEARATEAHITALDVQAFHTLAALARAVAKAERDGAMRYNTLVSGDTLPEHLANPLREAER